MRALPTKLKMALMAIMLTAGGAVAAAAEEVVFRFATPEEASAILTARDSYFSNLGALEIGIRLQNPDETSLDALSESYGSGLPDWTQAERDALNAVLAANADLIKDIAPLLPSEVLFLKVDNRVAGGLPHTRANGIVFPEGSVSAANDGLTRLFWHELYHVLSRQIADRHNETFALVGFKPCAFDAPEALHVRRLSNPDAPAIAHYAPAQVDGPAEGFIPYLYVPEGGYDPEAGGTLGNYFRFGLLEVTEQDGVCTAVPGEEAPWRLRQPDATPEFFDVAGRNTSYIIHPEEILADNFTLWMLGVENLPNPEIIERVADWHLKAAAAAKK